MVGLLQFLMVIHFSFNGNACRASSRFFEIISLYLACVLIYSRVQYIFLIFFKDFQRLQNFRFWLHTLMNEVF